MSYKCPLCLKELTKDDKLVQYCFQCKKAKLVTAQPSSIQNNSKCSKNDCQSHTKIEQGVYFAHLDCEKVNPFWDLDKLIVPTNAKLKGINITHPSKNGIISFRHWQIKLLDEIIESKVTVVNTENYNNTVSEVKEMWFPSMLLRATFENRPDQNQRFGQIVALIGNRSAGKTILALQSLNKKGYISTFINEKIELQDFIYSHRRENVVIQPIFELLYLRSLMEKDQPFNLPDGTTTENLNLYTVFFTPTKKALQKNEEPKTQKKGRLWDTLSNLLEMENASESFLFTLALYDVAGEDVQEEVVLIDKVKNSVDKISLVIDLNDLLLKKSNCNINIADHLRALKMLKSETKPFCVILTKADTFFKNVNFNLTPQNQESVFKKDGRALIKRILGEWRDYIINKKDENNPKHNFVDLINELISLETKNPIFMVETVNLPDKPNEPTKTPPISRGLDTFVCWALGVDRDEIIENR